MTQSFKTLYFSDYPAQHSDNKNVKLAFGARDSELYTKVGALSSEDIRVLLGYRSYHALRNAATEEDLSLNTFCLRVLRKKLGNSVAADSQLSLPGLLIDSRQATFIGGKEEPLHLWYPYLEGYSPDFVENILRYFAPKATRVLDPFSGAGTTPLVASQQGIEGLYCEINPLMQFLTCVKAKALALKTKQREALAEAIARKRDELPSKLTQLEEDSILDQAYYNIFGRSTFFETKAYRNVLRLRTWIDDIATEDVLVADFVAVAVVASLVPASLLTRAGDLRFKTDKERLTATVDLSETVIKQLTQMIEDLCRLRPSEVEPILLAEDAKSLANWPDLEIDTVITSPPYLNGTNYFRNTKVELWFLRCLRQPSDLAGLRFKAVTAGINDVTVRKPVLNSSNELSRVIESLEKNAYDLRIPRMVGAYFYDLVKVFDGLRKHLKSGATLAIDIGDSCYAGIHVPTDNILRGLLKDMGYHPMEDIVLRRRLSRNGHRLHQCLLVFSYKCEPEKNFSITRPHWETGWLAFKRSLPHQNFPYCRRNWGHPLHSLCSYEGKMKPSLAHFLIKTFVPTAGRILDPFAGVGTIPFEAALAGHVSFGFEISPAAHMIATAKVARPKPEECREFISKLETYIQDHKLTKEDIEAASQIRFNKSIPDYFHPQTLQEILLARKFFTTHSPSSNAEALVLASMLHILHGNRPYALSRLSHNTTPFSPRGVFEYRAIIPRLHDKVERGLAVDYPLNFKDGKIFYQDATIWWPQEVYNLDAIITSPPFFDSTRFYLGNWMRLWFCGWEKGHFNSKPQVFIDERQKKGFAVYHSIFRQGKERLKPGGVFVLHLGKSPKCDMAKELSREAKHWFRTTDIFSEDVGHCERHGVRDKGTVSAHQFLILQ